MSLSLWESFMCGGLAGCAAVTVSNTPEVMKTRLQLQGELQKADSNVPKVYKNVLDVFQKTWRNEGIKGLQRGLFPAYGYQILLNGSRLGFYDPIRRTLNRVVGIDPTVVNMGTALTAGALTGCIGAALGSPLFLVKARLQAYSPALPVGAQHYYRNSRHALSSIYREGGLKGLWRGVNTAILRTACGSAVQLPSYNFGKTLLVQNGWKDNSYGTYFVASAVSGLCVLLAMQPADTVLTRMYNQNTVKDPVTGAIRGALYSNPIDCLWKTLKTEGIRGWYKGTTAHFARIWPHTVVTLVANEVIMSQYKGLRAKYM
ncbi:mitochondrial carrier domain-containing protein [Kockovaella imperatae]|uniref:Mitochondrial carrier domain-containing protein n=1 Tax=Kockovaella imperatae TaxID=4999 RepID=A0A1Y1USC9_9TREE|nr:mitochondrial carrier domain-containing protein [Kockovaella imperatae]ORX40930.1 mitochondrial carrier domain-containing protein [Kockovaella imperatae]